MAHNRCDRGRVLAVLAALLAGCALGPGAGPPSPEPFAVFSVVAHRGYSAVAPENTLLAAERAITAGADLIEADVHRSADGVLYVIHDEFVDRTTDAARQYPARAPWSIRTLASTEIDALDAGAWFSIPPAPKGRYRGARVPRLEALLLQLRDRSGLLLEVKSPALYPGIEQDLATALQAAGWIDAQGRPRQRLAVQSFDWAWLARFQTLLPRVSTAALGGPPATAAQWDRIAFMRSLHPEHIHVSPELVAIAHRRGLRLIPYTVNDPARMRELIEWGVDGLITSQPALARRVLGEVRATRPP